MRGQLSIQFNWIFVLLVGGIILAFFLMIINNQQENATVQEANDLIVSLDTVLTTLSHEPDAADAFNIPNADISFECEPGLWRYFIQGTGPVSTRYDVIFTAQQLKGDQIISWTKRWNIPFEVATFTYLANDRTLFVFINSTNIDDNKDLKTLYDGLPSVFRKDYRTRGDLISYKPNGFDRYVVITPQAQAMDVANDIRTRWSYYDKASIRGVEWTEENYGVVSFITPGDGPDDKEFFLEETLWGAIFSEDADMYQCNLDKALVKLDIIIEILKNRAEQISNELTFTSCYDYFENLPYELEGMKTAAATFDAASMNEHRTTIIRESEDALRDRLCPYLY